MLGLAVTAIIQSSSATTVMVVGFVNAGLMDLNQCIGILFGSKIGTTVTSLILSFDIKAYVPLCNFAGAVIITFAKKNNYRYYGQILAGFNRHDLIAAALMALDLFLAAERPGLRSFGEKVILIAGGYDKHIPYTDLGPEICANVKKLFLGGATGPKIRDAVVACPEYNEQELPIVDCGDFESAVRAAAAAAEEGDVVLMSPASAAFDQFKNFMVRGEFYKKLVKEL